MNLLRTTTLSLAFVGLPLIGACSQPSSSAADTTATATAEAGKAQTLIGKTVERELAKARKELETGNLSLGEHGMNLRVSDGEHHGAAVFDDGNTGDQPKAEITPTGDLLIAGKAVAVTPAQRALLLQYRGQVIDVASAGMALGGKGADLAGKAIGESLGALFSGNTDEIEKRVEAEASKLEAEARLICKQLPPMMATQQQLATALPAFKPYANMRQDDIDDCMKDDGEHHVAVKF